jgi:alkanesulfonate monooxygenase SsuD/methylene tetrahydromethanopterin reductase-like flavin-dependent oxidoreductase (luciferase family)
VRESREALAVVEDGCTLGDITAAVDAAERSPEPLRTNLEAIVELSEEDAEEARQALWRLQADWPTLERLERQVGGQPEQAALRVGAAIHLARAELSSPAPQLRQRMPELLEMLGSEA